MRPPIVTVGSLIPSASYGIWPAAEFLGANNSWLLTARHHTVLLRSPARSEADARSSARARARTSAMLLLLLLRVPFASCASASPSKLAFCADCKLGSELYAPQEWKLLCTISQERKRRGAAPASSSQLSGLLARSRFAPSVLSLVVGV
jgi:hypothetical protein